MNKGLSIIKHSDDAGGNAMGISRNDPDRLMQETQCTWVDRADDEQFGQVGGDTTYWMEIRLPEWTGGEDYYLPYLNDFAWDEDATGSYRDYASFRALQAEMDLDDFFRRRGGGSTN